MVEEGTTFGFDNEFNVKGPDKNNTEGLRTALARLRNRTGPSIPQPSPPTTPLPQHHRIQNHHHQEHCTAGGNSSSTASAVSGEEVDTANKNSTTTNNTSSNGSSKNHEHYVPGSPIFREDRKTPPITPAPPSTPRSRIKGVSGPHHIHHQQQQHHYPQQTQQQPCTMTVSVTHATQGATVVTTKTSAVVVAGAPTHSYTSTRSAAMMALAMGQRPKSPASSSKSTGLANAPIKSLSSNNSNVIKSSTTTKAPSTAAVPVAIAHTNGILGPQSGGSGSSGSDNDGFNSSTSSTATALRRFYFKSGRSAKSKVNASATQSGKPLNAIGLNVGTAVTTTTTTTATYHEQHPIGVASHASVATTVAGVPKVVIMGSSTASMADTTINTSTESASTLVTSVTHTDTSETCDSLDLGDTSGQSEPLFSSLEEPLLTAIQIDSEHDGTELELTSCSMYSRPDMNLQDSTESQESSLSILVGEPSSTTPLLATHNRQQHHNNNHPPTRVASNVKERLPNTAPAPSSSTSHFTFDPPNSPKSARTSEKAKNHFTFKDNTTTTSSSTVSTVNGRQPPKQPTPVQTRRNFDKDERIRTTNFIEERQDNSPSGGRGGGGSGKIRSDAAYAYDYDYERELAGGNDCLRNKKSRNRDTTTSNSRNRYSTGGSVTANAIKTSPKRDSRRSPSSGVASKINSAPPTMKDSNFFGSSSAAAKPKQPSPSTQHQGVSKDQRKYSSSSSSGGSESRDRVRERTKDITMFPFDREALDYQRIQRECFAVDENSSSATASTDSDEAEHCSVYERKLSAVHHGSPKTADVFQQYTLLSQQEQHHRASISGGQVSRKNSKRRPESRRESQLSQHIPMSDAFYPQQKSTSSPSESQHPYNTQHSPKYYAELNKFEEIASKFDQLTPKAAGSNANLAGQTLNSPTGSMRGTTPPPLPDLRVDFFSETKQNQHHHGSVHKKSYKKKSSSTKSSSASAPSSALPAPHDNLDDCQRSGSGGAGAINVTPNPLEAAVCTQPRATIVVQQPSLSLDSTVETLLIKNEGDFISVEQGKDLARKRNSQQMQHPPHHPAGSQQQQQQLKRDENMRQLLDVTNTLTFEELRDFEMRYGSPHHSRSQSVKMPGSRASGRPNQLCLPQQRSRVASMPNTGVEEEYYRLRHFSITGKGVVNRGDSLKSRRSRSNNSVASSNSSTEHLTTTQIPAPNSARTSATCSLASSRESSTSNPGSGPYRVLMLGGPAVGKSSLVSQFMTSEYLHAYDTSIDDDSGEKAVSVLLNGEESELIFIDHSYTEMAPDDCLGSYDPHGYCVIYSASDRSSFTLAEHVLQVLWTNQNIAQKAVILVGNKADLARSRSVTTEEGKAMATAYDCKFIEASVGINHNVDELLVGLLSQIRLKLENPEKSRDLFRKRSIRKSKRRACSPLGSACLSGGATNPNTPLGPVNNVITDVNTPPSSAHSSPRKYRGSRTSTSLKVKGLLGRVWARDSKSKSCENLHVL